MTTAPMHLVNNVDIAGSIAVVCLSIYAFVLMRRLVRRRRGQGLYMYLYVQTVTLVIFACSRSMGHILKHLLVNTGRSELWASIAPISGTINSLAFVGFGLIALMYSNIKSMAEQMEAMERNKRELEASDVALRELLETKDVLLREIHHRVKNNMATVSSLLNLQSRSVSDEQTKRLLQESRNRIQSMALVHEQLYKSKNISEINVRDYIRALLRNVDAAFRPSGLVVKITENIDDMNLSIDDLIPLGLLCNELLANCYKHAFAGRSSGHISVGLLEQDGHIRLNIEDDGPGFPGGFCVEERSTLGMSLICALAGQLMGRIEASKGPGARFSLVFEPTQKPLIGL